MDPFVVDDAQKAKLVAAQGLVEVRDAAGKLLGRFVPTLPEAVYRIEGPIAIPSEEELDRRERESKSYTPEQVMERLYSLRGKRPAG